MDRDSTASNFKMNHNTSDEEGKQEENRITSDSNECSFDDSEDEAATRYFLGNAGLYFDESDTTEDLMNISDGFYTCDMCGKQFINVHDCTEHMIRGLCNPDERYGREVEVRSSTFDAEDPLKTSPVSVNFGRSSTATSTSTVPSNFEENLSTDGVQPSIKFITGNFGCIERYWCTKCGVGLMSSGDLDEHMALHETFPDSDYSSGRQTTTCNSEKGRLSTPSSSSLIRSSTPVEQNGPAISKENLTVGRTNDEEPYKCDVCGTLETSFSAWKMHTKLHQCSSNGFRAARVLATRKTSPDERSSSSEGNSRTSSEQSSSSTSNSNTTSALEQPSCSKKKGTTESGGYPCDICKITIAGYATWRLHMMIHNRPVDGTECGDRVDRNKNLPTDEATNNNERKGRSVAVRSDLRITPQPMPRLPPLLTNTLDVIYCNECFTQFADPYTFREHVFKKHKDKVWTCDMCKEQFKGLKYLEDHRLLMHNFRVEDLFPRPESPEESRPRQDISRKAVRREAMRFLRSRQPLCNPCPFRCDLCEQKFVFEDALNHHKLFDH